MGFPSASTICLKDMILDLRVRTNESMIKHRQLWEEIVTECPVRPRVAIIFWTLNEALTSDWKAAPFNPRHECFAKFSEWAKELSHSYDRVAFVIGGTAATWELS